MKKLVFVIVLLFATPLFAKDVLFDACTKDGKTATLRLDLDESAVAANHKVVGEIAAAFQYAANTLTADELADAPGFAAFKGKLTQEDWAAIAHFYGPPTVNTNFTCKAPTK